MEDLPMDVSAFLSNHPFLQLTDGKKIKCTLNGHEMPCKLLEIQSFTKGKKYEKLSAAAEFDYSQYEPHVVQSSKQVKQLFCKLTLRHLNRQPHHVLRHVNGKRFKKALAKYEECVRQGVEYVPIRLTQKRPKNFVDVDRGRSSKQGKKMWEPTSSGEEHSDSEDSLSDLYPEKMFSQQQEDAEEEKAGNAEEDDDFKTDEEEEMEVEVKEQPKRKKVQGGGFQKKNRNNNWQPSRHKKHPKLQNGK